MYKGQILHKMASVGGVNCVRCFGVRCASDSNLLRYASGNAGNTITLVLLEQLGEKTGNEVYFCQRV